MTKRTRTILFSICALLFLIFAPLIIFYCQGYRFDFDSKKIVQTGGLYFKIWPKRAKIYLNGKLKKKTDFLFGSALIEDLLPKKYDIEIKKEGYHSWKKTLEINEKKVTESKNIYLVPENPIFNDLVENVDSFWVSPDGRKITWKETKENSWALKIFEPERELKTHLINEEDLKEENKTSVEILDLKFSPNLERLLLKIKRGKETEYLIADIEGGSTNLIWLDFLGKDIKEIYFHPNSQQKIFLNTANDLFEVDLITKEKSRVLNDLIAHQIYNRDIFFISDDGFLFRTNLSGEIQERLNSEPFPLDDKSRCRLQLKGSGVFLLENDVVYSLDKESEKFEKLLSGIKNFEISPDNKKIFFSSDHEIWILFLEKTVDQPQKSAGERMFLTRFSKNITNPFWWTSHYLIFNVEGEIKIAEIDDRDRINIVDLTNFRESKIFFNRVDKKLYILSARNIFVSEPLLP